MPKKIFSLLLCVLLLSTLVKATHVLNLEMFYRWHPNAVSDSTYEFTLIIYNNCNGTISTPLPTVQLEASSQLKAQSSLFNVTLLPVSGAGVPALMPPNMYNCLGIANAMCIEEYVYRGIWTSPERASDWIFSFELCCPSPSISYENIVYDYLHIECGLNNLDFPDATSKNSSALWHNRRPNHPGYLTDTVINYYLNIVEVGRSYTIDGSVREYDNDSVSYNFYWPQGINGSNVAFKPGHSLQYPLPSNSYPLTINPISGLSTLVPGLPSNTGIYRIGIEVQEWRNDTIYSGSSYAVIPKQIGYNRREVEVRILDSNNYARDSVHIAEITLDTINADSTLEISFVSSRPFWPKSLVRCNSLSNDGSEFYIVDSATYVASNPASLKHIFPTKASWKCVTGNAEKVLLTFSEPLTCGDYYIFLKTGTDLDVIQSECGFWEPVGSSAKIVTSNGPDVNLGKDHQFCENFPYSLILNAGSKHVRYLWNTTDSLSLITVNYPDTFWVMASNKFNCHVYDTVIISEIPCLEIPIHEPVSNYSVSQKVPSNSIEQLPNSRIKIFPNPTTGLVNIESEFSLEEMTFELLSPNGLFTDNFFFQLTSYGCVLNLEKLTDGMYILQIRNKSEVLISKRILLTKD